MKESLDENEPFYKRGCTEFSHALADFLEIYYQSNHLPDRIVIDVKKESFEAVVKALKVLVEDEKYYEKKRMYTYIRNIY